MNRIMKNRGLFFALSLLWGLPLSLVGICAAILLRLCGKKGKRWCACIYYEVGKEWGGCNLGPVFLVQKGAGERLLCHEAGHAVQNCVFGPMMPFVVSIPSAVRYWARKRRQSAGKSPLTPYEAVWFERQATELGIKWAGKK